MSYADALGLALSKRSELTIGQLKVDQASARVDEANALSLPSLDAFSTVERIWSYQTFSGVEVNAVLNGTPIPVSVNAFVPPYQIRSGLQLTYNLYSGGLNPAKVQEQVAGRDAAQAQLQSVRKALVLETTVAYWELRKAQILQRAAQANLDSARQALAAAQTRYDQGRIAHIELDTYTLAAQTREIELRERSRQQSDCLRRYDQALGIDAPAPGDAAMPSLSSNAADVQVDRLVLDLGLESTPEVAAAVANVAAAQARSAQARSEFQPTVDLFAGYTGIGRGNDSLPGALSAYGRDNYTIGVQLKWNLFNGRGSTARSAEAAREVELTRLKAEEAQRDQLRNWQDKRSREAELRNMLELAGKQAELAQAELRVAKSRQATTENSTVDLVAAQSKADDAASKVRVAEIDLLVARVATRLAGVD